MSRPRRSSVSGRNVRAGRMDRRVEAQDRPLEVRHIGTVFDPEATVLSAGVAPLDVLVVGYA